MEDILTHGQAKKWWMEGMEIQEGEYSILRVKLEGIREEMRSEIV